MTSKLAFRLAAVVAILTLNTACGAISFINNATVSTTTVNNDTYGNLSVDLGTVGLVFPTLSLPITEPNQPGVTLGTVAIANGNSLSQATLTVSVDLTKLDSIPHLGNSAVLPNGQAIPVSGIDTNNLLVLNAPGTNIAIYVDFNQVAQSGMLGVAIPIQQLNAVGLLSGGIVNIFPSFQLSNGVTGTAGIFTGMMPGTSGLAMFVDVTQMVQAMPTVPSPQSLSDARSYQGLSRTKHSFLSVRNGSSAQQSQVLSEIYKLGQQHAHVTLTP
jgi:hypothetical protein